MNEQLAMILVIVSATATAGAIAYGLLFMRDRSDKKLRLSTKQKAHRENRSVAAGWAFIYFFLVVGGMINVFSLQSMEFRAPVLMAMVPFSWAAFSYLRTYIRLGREK